MHSPRSLVLPRLTFWAFPLYLVSLCLPGLPIRLWPFAACLLDPACLVISSLSAACPDLCIVPVADSALPTWHLLLPLTLACLTLPCCSIKLHLNLTPLTPHVTIAVITASTLIWGLFKKMWSVSVGIFAHLSSRAFVMSNVEVRALCGLVRFFNTKLNQTMFLWTLICALGYSHAPQSVATIFQV